MGSKCCRRGSGPMDATWLINPAVQGSYIRQRPHVSMHAEEVFLFFLHLPPSCFMAALQ